MSSKKRGSVSPASASDAELKRQRENEDLQCLICLELVVDAVQVRCCGVLHCRACISKCEKCPLCRKTLRAGDITPDTKSERLSAAAVRPCLYKEDGCMFEGNRASITAHHDICDFVPRSVLRERIQEFQREQTNQMFAHCNEKYKLIARIERSRLISENSMAISERAQAEKLEMQEALMKCALGPEPAEAALKVLYDIPDDEGIATMYRRVANGKPHFVCHWAHLSIELRVRESNHNVAVWFEQEPMSYEADEEFPGCIPNLIARLLHPHDVTRAKEISLQSAELNVLQNGPWQAGFENFMTTKELDEYCFDGKYYIAF